MIENNEDGMRYPSIDKLLKKKDTFVDKDGNEYSKSHTKYQLAYIAAKRARLIEEDERRKDKLIADNDEVYDDEFLDDEIDSLCVKPVGIALEEYLDDRVHCSFKSDKD